MASTQIALRISPAEQALLVGLLEAALADTRVEVRRTSTPDFHDELRRDEERIRSLLDRVRGL
jgi:hypothetical protein